MSDEPTLEDAQMWAIAKARDHLARGAAIACALLFLKLNPVSSRNMNWWWWCLTLCAFIWSTYWVLALGTSFNGW